MDHITFISTDETFEPDTCAPLRDAGYSGAIELFAMGRGTYPGEEMPDDQVPELRSVGTWKILQEQSWGLDWHRNEGIELTFVTAGQLDFECDDASFNLTPGTVSITRPWQLHRVGRPHVGPSVLTWFILDVGVRRPNQEWVWPNWLPLSSDEKARLTALLSHNESAVWQVNKEMLANVARLERILRSTAGGKVARLAMGVAEILIELGSVIESKSPALDPHLSSGERTVALFLTNLVYSLDESWTLDMMARACGVSRTSFIALCKQRSGLTPSQYLTRLRIRKAGELLESTDRKIAEIAYECGFQSSQYFATVFRQQTGYPPTRARRYSKNINPEVDETALVAI